MLFSSLIQRFGGRLGLDRMGGPMQVKNDVLSGLTVALALVPEAVAFALIAGIPVESALTAAFMVGMITALVGGRPGMVSSAAGALAVVMIGLVEQFGLQYLYAAVIVMGALQILVGVLRLGKFIRMVPYPVMLGFVNGLAIVIFIAQLQQFEVSCTPEQAKVLANLPSWLDMGYPSCGDWLPLNEILTMLAIILITMAIIEYLPRITRVVPSALAAILVTSLGTIALGLETRTVGDLANLAGGLPEFSVPDIEWDSWDAWKVILPAAFVFAGVGTIESLLTLTLIDDMTDTHGKANRECVGLGIANVATGFFSGMGGCALIGQSMVNINAGGRGRLSGFMAGLFLLIFVLFASGLIGKIPVAALVGVMFIVVIKTFEWASFRILPRIPRADAFVLILVSVVTVVQDLAVAVVVGVIASSLSFAWTAAKRINTTTRVDENGWKIYDVRGPLFFSSVSNFRSLFTPHDDPDDVVVEFLNSRVLDHSGLVAIDGLAERYSRLGKRLHLRHLSPECQELLTNARGMVEVNVLEDPEYHVASDKLD